MLARPGEAAAPAKTAGGCGNPPPESDPKRAELGELGAADDAEGGVPPNDRVGLLGRANSSGAKGSGMSGVAPPAATSASSGGSSAML